MFDSIRMYGLEGRRSWGAHSRRQDWFVGGHGPCNREEREFAGRCESARGKRERYEASLRESCGGTHPTTRGPYGFRGEDREMRGFRDREERGFRGRGMEEQRGFGGSEEYGRGGRAARGFGGGRHGGPGFGFGGGGGRERLFEGGDLKLVILKLIAEKPSYGYELIKTMEERLSGGYAPSPGVVYPTLTLLEEEGLTTVATSEAGKKVYTVTDAGKAELAANQRRLGEIFDRIEHAGRGFQRGRSPEIMRAFMSLRSAVQARVSREGLTPEQMAKMAEAIEAAARAIDAI